MSWSYIKRHRISLGLSGVAHLVLFGCLFFYGHKPVSVRQQAQQPVAQTVIQATTLDVAAVDKAMHALKDRQQSQERRARQQLKALQHAQYKAKKALRAREHKMRQMAKKERMTQRRIRSAQQKQAALARKLKQKKAALSQLQKQKKVEVKRLAQHQAMLQQELMQDQLRKEKQALQQPSPGVVNRYRARVLRAIQQHWIVPVAVKHGLFSEFLIHLSAAGRVQSVKLLKTSGNAVLDRSARIAVLKASPLPIPKDRALLSAFRVIRLKVSPSSTL